MVQVLINSKGYNMNPIQSLYYVSPACLICLLVPFREWGCLGPWASRRRHGSMGGEDERRGRRCVWGWRTCLAGGARQWPWSYSYSRLALWHCGARGRTMGRDTHQQRGIWVMWVRDAVHRQRLAFMSLRNFGVAASVMPCRIYDRVVAATCAGMPGSSALWTTH